MLFLTLLVAMNANAQGSAGTEVDIKTKSLAEFKELCEPENVPVNGLSAFAPAQVRLDAWRRDIPGLGSACLDEVFEWPWLRPTKRCRIKTDKDSGLAQSVEKHASFVVLTPLYDAQNDQKQQQSHVHEAARHCVDKFDQYNYPCRNGEECHPDLKKEEEARWEKHEKRVKELSVLLWVGHGSNSEVKADMLKKTLGTLFLGKKRWTNYLEARLIPEQLEICSLIDQGANEDAVKSAMLRIREIIGKGGPSYWWSDQAANDLFTFGRQINTFGNLSHVRKPILTFHDKANQAIIANHEKYEAFIGEDWDQRIEDYQQACKVLAFSPDAISNIRGETAPSLFQTQVEAPAPTQAVAQGQAKATRGVLLPGTRTSAPLNRKHRRIRGR